MIKLSITQVYNSQPYYAITQNGKTYNALTAEQAAKVVRDLRKGREKVDTSEVERAVELIKKDTDELIKLLKF